MIDEASEQLFDTIKLPGKRPPVAEIVKKILNIALTSFGIQALV